MTVKFLEENQDYKLTGEGPSVIAAEQLVRQTMEYIVSKYDNASDLVVKRAWKKVLVDTNIFIKTTCLEDSTLLLSRKSLFDKTRIDERFQDVLTRYHIVELVVKDFPVKRQNPIKANYRRDYDKKVDDSRFFFSVDGMTDKETKQAFEMIAPIFDEIVDRYTKDKDIRWRHIGEGLRETLKRNNFLATHILENRDFFTKQHIRHLMNEVRKDDATPEFIDESEEYIFEDSTASENSGEASPASVYDFTVEDRKNLKWCGGYFDRLLKGNSKDV